MGHDLQEKSFMYLFRGAPINCSLLHVCKEVYYIVSDIIPTGLTLRIVLCIDIFVCGGGGWYYNSTSAPSPNFTV